MQSLTFLMLLFAAPPNGTPAATPGPSTAPAPDARAALEAAKELLRHSQFDARMQETALRTSGSSFDTIVAAKEAELGQPLPDDLKLTVKRIVLEEITRTIERMKPYALNQAAEVYSRHFTADELRELTRLKFNPVIAKAERLSPQLFSELSQIGLKEAAESESIVTERIKQAVADWLAIETGKRPNAS